LGEQGEMEMKFLNFRQYLVLNGVSRRMACEVIHRVLRKLRSRFPLSEKERRLLSAAQHFVFAGAAGPDSHLIPGDIRAIQAFLTPGSDVTDEEEDGEEFVATRPNPFRTKLNGKGASPSRGQLNFRSHTAITRRDFGILNYFPGAIDDQSLNYNESLSRAEIQQLALQVAFGV
jgi:hypothetical protein